MAASAPVYLMAPPPGQVRTPVNPPSSGGAVVPAGIAATIVACVCVALRVFTRVHVVSGDLGWDDYLVLCALVFSISFFFVGRHLYAVGAGLHMWDVLFSDYSPRFLQTTVGATLTYAISISFSKLSILAFYLRVSPDQHFRRAVYALLGVVAAYTVTYIFVIVFRCHPVAAAWDLSIKGGTCIEYLIPMMVLSIANIVIDLVILFLPVKVIVPLQIPLRQKISLVLLFATGGFVCAAAIKRTLIMPPLMSSPDYSWDLTEQFIWSFVEVNAGIVCASLAALKPLFMRYLPVLIVSRLRSSHDRSAAEPSDAMTKDGAGERTAASSSNGTLYGHSYEMPRRDESPADDEAQLWARKPEQAKAAPSSVTTSEAKNDVDSIDGLGDLYPGARPPVYAVTGSGFDAQGLQSPDGIQVTKETFVTYGERGCP
ncbi:integral membrane protein [Hirsutella rhossiliensis]|uniref:Integral membrane protein n=1 Tax=Hirsutella rhossiliensis TaxID=111463 RepID=A0A9P8N3D6_9HYPO|nr:uncharacterized protein HRG_04101 [Hirsutella rhossiliensis]KAH0966085.1 integral membrane protein [Hirsutella rhossiliensis]